MLNISLLLEAGIPQQEIDFQNHKFAAGFQSDNIEWFQLFSDACEEAHKIYKLVEPQVWGRYKTMKLTGLREQVLVAPLYKKIRHLWKRRPK